MTESQNQFWQRHYDGLAEKAQPWLDYSNERVQAQTFAVALEAAGAIHGRTCLDFGCGFGALSLTLEALGASATCGLDQSAVMVAANRQKRPSIQWILGQASDIPDDHRFDLIFAVEVIQYLPLHQTVQELWRCLAPGGRLVIVVPNRDCPIVSGATERYHGQYWPPSIPELAGLLPELPGLALARMRGLAFGSDQTLVPYELSPWSEHPTFSKVPNRLVLVAIKAGPIPENPGNPE